MSFIIGLLASLLEKVGLNWWDKHEKEEATNARADVDAKSDTDVGRVLDADWTRKQ